jgi:hypothetical protein
MNWISICGEESPALETELTRAALETRVRGGMKPELEEYVQTLRILGDRSSRFIGDLSLSAERLELLRRLCQMYDVEIRPQSISSHRPVIGSCIVLVKKALFRIVAALLGPTLRQQREFNATVVTLLCKLSSATREGKDGEAL